MSGLRQSVLETIRMIGNHSGCHQMPERSFFYKGKQFPVCARCTGVIIGQSVALIIGIFKDISFKTDKDKINLEERIKKLSPDTEISIL